MFQTKSTSHSLGDFGVGLLDNRRCNTDWVVSSHFRNPFITSVVDMKLNNNLWSIFPFDYPCLDNPCTLWIDCDIVFNDFKCLFYHNRRAGDSTTRHQTVHHQNSLTRRYSNITAWLSYGAICIATRQYMTMFSLSHDKFDEPYIGKFSHWLNIFWVYTSLKPLNISIHFVKNRCIDKVKQHTLLSFSL